MPAAVPVAVDAGRGFAARAAAVRDEGLAAVERRRERDLRIGEGVVADHGGDLARLGGRRAQELEARRLPPEQVAHGDRGAGGGAAASGVCTSPPARRTTRRLATPLPARYRLDLGDGGDARQRLAAEAQRRDRVEVLVRWRACWWRGARRRAPTPRRLDAAAVVDDADQPQRRLRRPRRRCAWRRRRARSRPAP